jgi:hypothetical protein
MLINAWNLTPHDIHEMGAEQKTYGVAVPTC